MTNWNPHPYIVAAARRIWQWDPERRACLQSGQRGKAPNVQRHCESCEQWFSAKEIHADHIEPVGKQPRTWDEYPGFFSRLFVERAKLQRLCKPCHKPKSNRENKERRARSENNENEN